MKKRFISLLTAIITVLLLSSCGSNNHATKKIESITDLNGLNMGCMSGSIFDVLIEEKFPDSNIIYFGSRSELLLGLTSGKIDGFISDEPVAMKMVNENDGVTYLDEAVGEVHYGICFSDNKKDVLNEFNGQVRGKEEGSRRTEEIKPITRAEHEGENGVREYSTKGKLGEINDRIPSVERTIKGNSDGAIQSTGEENERINGEQPGIEKDSERVLQEVPRRMLKRDFDFER